MSRFFKSAAFPILIVIVLAFFASKLIQSGNEAPRTSYSQFLAQIDDGAIETVTLRTKDNSAEVTLKGADPKKYTIGWVQGDRRGRWRAYLSATGLLAGAAYPSRCRSIRALVKAAS